jgi:hypothetical protein
MYTVGNMTMLEQQHTDDYLGQSAGIIQQTTGDCCVRKSAGGCRDTDEGGAGFTAPARQGFARSSSPG